MGISEKKATLANDLCIAERPAIHERWTPLPRGVGEVNWDNKFAITFTPNNPLAGVDAVTEIRVGHDFCKCQRLACLAFFEYDHKRGEYRQVSLERSGGKKAKFILLGPADEYTIYKKPTPVQSEE
ncbi:MAG: hypothetical protein KJ002_02595 [Candidatus Dadabacteria bacterium]|nr:hypothetical protein [Candidatus Dadabacteria bacterium]